MRSWQSYLEKTALADSPPIGGMTWSSSFMLVRFQICLMMALSSSLAFSKLPVWRKEKPYKAIVRLTLTAF